MEVEKRGSRGGFFHMFDWNRKSRKKLFSNNPDLFGIYVVVLVDSEYVSFGFHLYAKAVIGCWAMSDPNQA